MAMTDLRTRLQRLEQRALQSLGRRGWRTFTTFDGARLFETTGRAMPWSECGASGREIPTGWPTLTASDIAKIERAGWRCFTIHYVEDWRSNAP